MFMQALEIIGERCQPYCHSDAFQCCQVLHTGNPKPYFFPMHTVALLYVCTYGGML